MAAERSQQAARDDAVPPALADWAFDDPDFALLPSEWLEETGLASPLGAALHTRRGWSRERIALLDAGLERYRRRTAAIVRSGAPWPAPALRNLLVMETADRLRPYAQVLGTSTSTLYAADLDTERSHPELVAWLLAEADWMRHTGEVSLAGVRAAAWWLAADDDACDAFACAAARATRPDAERLRRLAEALPWVRRLGHETLRPGADGQPIPGTGLVVPRGLEREPIALGEACRAAAERCLAGFRRRWRGSARSEVDALRAWLAHERPPLLVRAGEASLWDPRSPERTSDLANALATADPVAVAAIRADLEVLARRTRAIQAALGDVDALEATALSLDPGGYCHLDPQRRRLVYDLLEADMERLAGPPLPHARNMLGARAAHEWGHLADAAGLVPCTVAPQTHAARVAALGDALEDAVVHATPSLRRLAEPDLQALAGPSRTSGAALAELLLTRLPDWRANRFVRRFATTAERETYARHNVRALGGGVPAARLFRLLVRYLYELQYLEPDAGLSSVADGRELLLRSTGARSELLESGLVDEARFHGLADAVAAVLACFALDETRLHGDPA